MRQARGPTGRPTVAPLGVGEVPAQRFKHGLPRRKAFLSHLAAHRHTVLDLRDRRGAPHGSYRRRDVADLPRYLLSERFRQPNGQDLQCRVQEHSLPPSPYHREILGG